MVLTRFVDVGHHVPLVYSDITPGSLGAAKGFAIQCSVDPGETEAPAKLSDDLKPYLSGVEVRMYTPFLEQSSQPPETESSESNPPKSPHFLVINGMTPHPSSEKMFNDWYTEEHIPMLSRVPSWLSSHRYILQTQSADSKAPRYLALHRWGDIAAFEQQEFKAATNTPWRTKVIEQVVEKERFVMEFQGTLEDLVGK